MIRRLFRATALSLVLLAGACNSHSQPQPQRAATTAPSIDARHVLGFLASDELEGRGVGTAGLDRAAQFIAGAFTQSGLKPLADQKNFFQPFDLTTTMKIGPNASLRVGEQKFAPMKDFTPMSFSGEGKFSGPVVFVGYGMQSQDHHYDDYANIDVKGKVVLAMRYEPHDEKGKSRFGEKTWSSDASILTKAKLAREHGAVALLLAIPPGLPNASLPQITADANQIPVLFVKQNVADELLRRGGFVDLKSAGRKIDDATKPMSVALKDVEVTGEADVEWSKSTVKNVVGYLPGKNHDEFIVIGAHYDHLGRGGFGSMMMLSREIHNGADDNASGTTALMMLASRLASQPMPARSIIFIAFAGEEVGLRGSNYFVGHPIVPLSKIVAMINLDMVGRVECEALYIGGGGTAKDFDEVLNRADEKSLLELKTMTRGGMGPSDHASFAAKGIPVLFFHSGLHGDYHRPTDDAEKINFAGLEQVVDLVVDVANGIDALPRQSYVSANDEGGMAFGFTGGPKRARLGVMPDYEPAGGAGMRISGVSPDSPAAKAGLKAGDVITQIDQTKIQSAYDLMAVLNKTKAGQKVRISVIREKQKLDLDATLAEQ